jgi:hypothetical protein
MGLHIMISGRGHSRGTGKGNGKAKEFPMSRTWSDVLASKLREKGYKVSVVSSAPDAGRVSTVNSVSAGDDPSLLIEIGFAEGLTRKTRGSAVYHGEDERSLSLATEVHAVLVDGIKENDRGLLLHPAENDLHLQTNCPSILIEATTLNRGYEGLLGNRDFYCEQLCKAIDSNCTQVDRLSLVVHDDEEVEEVEEVKEKETVYQKWNRTGE